MAPKYHHPPISGGDRKAPTKELSKSLLQLTPRERHARDEQHSDHRSGYRKRIKRGWVFLSWRLLRSIGKLTVLIPLIGYLILLNDRVVAHLGLFGESERSFGIAAVVRLNLRMAVPQWQVSDSIE
jgi:hypothetical protein